MGVAISEAVVRRVAGSFDPKTFARGLAYAREGRVNLVRAEWPVVAQVRGSTGYVVTVHYTQANQHLRGDCTCPVGLDCKHAAAAALVALAGAREHTRAQHVARKQDAVGEWLAGFGVAIDAGPSRGSSENIVAYVIGPDSGGTLAVTIHSSRALRRGGFARGSIMAALGDPARGAPAWVPLEDLRRVALLRAVARAGSNETALRLDRIDAALLRDLADSGHLFWKEIARPLAAGPARTGTLGWQPIEDGSDEMRIALDEPLILVPAHTCHYIDIESATIGELDVGAPAPIVQQLVQSPPVPTAMLPTVRRSLRPVLSPAARAGLVDAGGVADHDEPERPLLHLAVSLERDHEGEPYVDVHAEAIYADAGGGDRRFTLAEWDARRPVSRDLVFEGRQLQRLQQLLDELVERRTDHGTELLARARHVAHRVVPVLAEQGWSIQLDPELPVEPVVLATDWVESLKPLSDSHGWFSLELGVVIAGRTVPLLPILLTAIRDGQLPLDGSMLDGADLAGINLRQPGGELVHVSGERLHRWLRPLLELRLRGSTEDGALVMPDFTAVEIAETAPGRFSQTELLAEARQRLERLLNLQPRAEPASFAGELRAYQRQGLAWLHVLHELGYGGLLADDMGLGKTVQVLAFLEGLRAGGGLDSPAPALVVAPRSVVGHWHSEAIRFASALAPTVHLGPGRARTTEELQRSPLVITSYQTLLRDHELFERLGFTTIVFDEAQALKNPETSLRRAAARLQARSRFGITGTPIENHLRELWSQLDITMPGLLGRKATFDAVFRRSIEKYGDDDMLELLRRRIRPFLLRRTKREVELDLPDKTEIIEHVDLGTSQRDLYESLRLSLDQDVREALRGKGVQGSSLVVLNALLELRQCCCDPRLLSLPRAKQMKSSAKLERLMSMLEELVDNGHAVLVFSQFTSMLGLIEAECRSAQIPFLSLTGRTRDRDGVVRAFQAGEAPVFLISLKAGGTGLNLTRADTVIHYDPWWNPAAEDQATDRAHRIGQDKQVFVYKLVARGTLEERIMVMQREKRALTTAALHRGGASHLVPSDLGALYHQLV
ncbi:MAG TPA: DEAD/DEAH box helicase [Kofleriaceae bacterium]|nr:DEAD/DEAH box helicase [Kofleriaceae bacterium]